MDDNISTTQLVTLAKAQAIWLRTVDMAASADVIDALTASLAAALPDTQIAEEHTAMSLREAFDRGRHAQKAFSEHAAWRQRRELLTALTTIATSDDIDNDIHPERNKCVAKQALEAFATPADTQGGIKAVVDTENGLKNDPGFNLDKLIPPLGSSPLREFAKLLYNHQVMAGQRMKDYAGSLGIPYDDYRRIVQSGMCADDLALIPTIEKKVALPPELKSRLYQTLGAGPRPA